MQTPQEKISAYVQSFLEERHAPNYKIITLADTTRRIGFLCSSTGFKVIKE
jgi:hypothetical protein